MTTDPPAETSDPPSAVAGTVDATPRAVTTNRIYERVRSVYLTADLRSLALGRIVLALVLLRDNASFTLPLGINAQIGQYTSEYQLIAAASIIASLPIFAIYLALQGQFERGVTEGALKA